jgi:hypothetical protein
MAKGTTKEVAFLKGRRMRVTRLDACGRVVYGDNARATSEGFISIGVTSNTNSTDEIRVQNASGATILYEASVTELAGFSPEISLGRVDPEMLSLMTGQPVVLDALGNVVGFDIDTKISLAGRGFALEVWAGAPAGGDGCTDASATGQYGYVLFPFLQGGVLGDFSIENGGISFTLTGAATKDGNAWGKGPYNVQLNGLAGAQTAGKLVQGVSTTTALRVMVTDVAPPTARVGTRPLLDPAAPALTSVTATKIGTTREYTIVAIPDPANNVGVEYDFGDGTWDFVLGGDTKKLYAAAGTYVIQASTNGTIVTTTVTVA